MGPMLSTVSARMFVRFDQSDQIQHGYQCRGAACFQGSAMPPSQGNGTSAPPFSGALTYAHKQQPNFARWSNYVRVTFFRVHCVCSHRLNLTNGDAWSVCFANLPYLLPIDLILPFQLTRNKYDWKT